MSTFAKVTLDPAQSIFFTSLVEKGKTETNRQALAFDKREDVQERKKSDRELTRQSVGPEKLATLARDSLKFSSACFIPEDDSDDLRNIKGSYSRLMLHPPSWANGKELDISEQKDWIDSALQKAFQAAQQVQSSFKIATEIHEPKPHQKHFLDPHFDDKGGYIFNPQQPNLRVDHLSAGYRPNLAVTIYFEREGFKILANLPSASFTTTHTIMEEEEEEEETPPKTPSPPPRRFSGSLGSSSRPLPTPLGSRKSNLTLVATSPARTEGTFTVQRNDLRQLQEPPLSPNFEITRNPYRYDFTDMVLIFLISALSTAIFMACTQKES